MVAITIATAVQPKQPGLSINAYTTTHTCPDSLLKQAFKGGSVFPTRSRIECAAKCGQDPKCRSWEYDKNTTLCQLGLQPFHTDCANTEPAGESAMVHYDNKNFCFNDGELDLETGGCICHNATWGPRCELIMRDCNDWKRVANSDQNTLYWIQPATAPEPFQVWCRLGGRFARLYVLFREDNSESWNRTWEEYKAGFGVVGSGSFWLGLDRLHWLTVAFKRVMTIKVTLMDGSVEYRSYRNTYVDDEAHNYQLSLSGGKNSNFSIHDCFGYLDGANFSTVDRDNNYIDGQRNDCAARFGGGWWYLNTTCGMCNAVGNFTWPEDGVWDGEEKHAFWGNSSGIHMAGGIWGYIAPKLMQITILRQDP